MKKALALSSCLQATRVPLQASYEIQIIRHATVITLIGLAPEPHYDTQNSNPKKNLFTKPIHHHYPTTSVFL
jgi:hypothetical protein